MTSEPIVCYRFDGRTTTRLEIRNRYMPTRYGKEYFKRKNKRQSDEHRVQKENKSSRSSKIITKNEMEVGKSCNKVTR